MNKLSIAKRELIKLLGGTDDWKFVNATGLSNIIEMTINQLETALLNFCSSDDYELVQG